MPLELLFRDSKECKSKILCLNIIFQSYKKIYSLFNKIEYYKVLGFGCVLVCFYHVQGRAHRILTPKVVMTLCAQAKNCQKHAKISNVYHEISQQICTIKGSKTQEVKSQSSKELSLYRKFSETTLIKGLMLDYSGAYESLILEPGERSIARSPDDVAIMIC